MKVMNIFSLSLLGVASCLAMERELSIPPKPRILTQEECAKLAGDLTLEEKECALWAFKDPENMKIFGQSYSCFKPEERDDFTALNYAQNPDKVEALGKRVLTQFYKNMKEAQKEVKYSSDLTLKTFLHMKYQNQNKTITDPKDEIEVRQYIFQHKLNDVERASFQEKGFKANPEFTYATAQKMGMLIAEMMASKNMISNTPEAKAKKAQEYVEEKKTAFASWYISNQECQSVERIKQTLQRQQENPS